MSAEHMKEKYRKENEFRSIFLMNRGTLEKPQLEMS